MSDSLAINGTLVEIFPEQTFPSGFSKREFVIQTADRYPQPVKFELFKERAAQLDAFQVGDPVTVHFNLRGNEYEGRYYVNLVCWKLAPANGNGQPAPATRPAAPQSPAAALALAPAIGDDEDIPF